AAPAPPGLRVVPPPSAGRPADRLGGRAVEVPGVEFHAAPVPAAPAPVVPAALTVTRPAVTPPRVSPPPVQEVPDPKQQGVPSVERALSGPGRDRNASWHGKVKIVTGNGAAQG